MSTPLLFKSGAALDSTIGPLILGDGLILTSNVLSAAGTGSYPTILAGPGIGVSTGTGTVTITNEGAFGVAAGPGISVSEVNGVYTVCNTLPGPQDYGTVKSVTAGTGLTGGTITTSGTIALGTVPSIAPGTYNYATITVDQYGRVTFASPGTIPQPLLGSGAITVSNTIPQIVSVASASTASCGVVRLSDSTNDSSTTKAATARTVKVSYDLANTAKTKADTASTTSISALAQSNTALTQAGTAITDSANAVTTAGLAQTDATTALACSTVALQDAATALGTANAAQTAASNANSNANTRIGCNAFGIKGQILAGLGASSFTAVNVGTNGQVLVADSNTASGLKWASAPTGTVTSVTAGPGLTGGPITTTGSLALDTTGVVPGTYTYPTLTVDSTGRLTTVSNGATPVTAAIFTNKGQIIAAGGAGALTVLNAGSDGQYLRACAACGSGVHWANFNFIPCSLLTTKGTLLTSANGIPAQLPPGANGKVLSSWDSCAAGLRWITPCQGTVTSVTAGTGLTGGTINGSGTIALASTGITPGSYNYASFTVDSYGRLSSATSGNVPSTSVTSPITNTGTSIAPVIGVDTASTTALGVVKIGNNINVTSGTISVKNASELQSGVVQLDNTLTSTSTSKALTAAQGKYLKDQLDLVDEGNVFAGTLDPVADTLIAVTAQGIEKGFVVGQALPAAGPDNDRYFVVARETSPTYVPPGGLGAPGIEGGDWVLSENGSWNVYEASTPIHFATTTVTGITRLSTLAEGSGSCAGIALTPAAAQGAYVAKDFLKSNGSLMAGGQSGTVIELLPPGSSGQVLVTNTACNGGLAWSTDFLHYSDFTGAGYLLAGLGPSQPIGVAPGTDGQVLSACASCSGGLTWVTPASSADIPCSAFLESGNLLVGSGNSTFTALPPGTSGQFLTAGNSGTVSWQTYNNLAIPCACLASKGDLVTSDGNAPTSLPVGADGYVLQACSTASNGLAWVASSAGGGVPCSLFTTASQLITSDGANSPVALSPGSEGEYLTIAAGGSLTWCSLPPSWIPLTAITAKGALITGSGPGTVETLAPSPADGRVLTSCDACAGGITWASVTSYVSQEIPCSTITAKGDIIVGSAPNTPQALSVGTDNYILRACQACPLGVTWTVLPAEEAIPCAALTGKGALVSASAAGQLSTLPVGNNGYVLTACDQTANGLTWVQPTQDVPCSIFQGKGDLLVAQGSASPAALPVGFDNYVLTAKSSSPTGLSWEPANTGNEIPCNIILNKGDLIAGAASGVPIAIGVGANGYFLRACSTCIGGLAWVPETPSYEIPCSVLTGRGDLIVASAAGTPTALPIGANNAVLTACSSCPNGVYWSDQIAAQLQSLQDQINAINTILANNNIS